MFTPDWAELTRFAIALAQASAAEILPFFRRNTQVDIKDGPVWDPVTEGDRAGERIIRQMIEARYPDHGILGEEYGAKESRSPFTWVLDPWTGPAPSSAACRPGRRSSASPMRASLLWV